MPDRSMLGSHQGLYETLSVSSRLKRASSVISIGSDEALDWRPSKWG